MNRELLGLHIKYSPVLYNSDLFWVMQMSCIGQYVFTCLYHVFTNKRIRPCSLCVLCSIVYMWNDAIKPRASSNEPQQYLC